MDDDLAAINGVFEGERRSDIVVPKPRGADGVMLIAFDRDVGAAYYSNEVGAWITQNPEPLTSPPFIPVDGHIPLYFPPYAVLAIAAVHAAVVEYLRTGAKPTRVEWTRVNWNTVAG